MMGREYSPSAAVLVAEAALSLAAVAGVLLNLLLLVRQRRRVLVAAWAVCNVLALAKTPLLVASVHTGHWPAGQTLCSLYVAACTLQMWTAPWLLALAAMNLCIQNARVRKLAAGLSGAMGGAAVLYGFCYAFHLQTEDDSSCLVHLPSGDPLWPVLSGFVFSFHTPTVAAACFLLVTAVQQPKDATKLKTTTAILVSQVVLFHLYWVTQFQLLEKNAPETHSLKGIVGFLLAAVVMDLHTAIAVPSLLLWCGHCQSKIVKAKQKEQKSATSESLDGFLESLKIEHQDAPLETD